MTPAATTQAGLSVQKTRNSGRISMGTVAKPPRVTVPAGSSAVRRNAKTQPSHPSEPELPSGSDRAVLLSASAESKRTGSYIKSVSGTVKGRAAFNRPKLASEELLRQKREKEEAARKARAEAAQKGRLASREWAAKQGQKKDEAKLRKLGEAKIEPAIGATLCEG